MSEKPAPPRGLITPIHKEKDPKEIKYELIFDNQIYNVKMNIKTENLIKITVEKKKGINLSCFNSDLTLKTLKEKSEIFFGKTKIEEAFNLLIELFDKKYASITKINKDICLFFKITEHNEKCFYFELKELTFEKDDLILKLIEKCNELENEIELLKEENRIINNNNIGNNINIYDRNINNNIKENKKNNKFEKKKNVEEEYIYKYFMAPITGTNKLIIFDPEVGWYKKSFSKSDFENDEVDLTSFGERIRCINLGSSLLITGGTLNNSPTSKCYQISINPININSPDNSKISLKISLFPSLACPRSHHSIIFLPDRNMVVVCGGEQQKSSEYFIIDKNKNWEILPEFKNIRWNSSLAYINQRYVYSIGGYTGTILSFNNYLNNIEFIDLNSQNKMWKEIQITNVSFKSDSIGIIPLSNNELLLVGGYYFNSPQDGYYRLKVGQEPESIIFNKENKKLPGTCHFADGPFIKFENTSYNKIKYQENIFCYNIFNDCFYIMEGANFKEK